MNKRIACMYYGLTARTQYTFLVQVSVAPREQQLLLVQDSVVPREQQFMFHSCQRRTAITTNDLSFVFVSHRENNNYRNTEQFRGFQIALGGWWFPKPPCCPRGLRHQTRLLHRRGTMSHLGHDTCAMAMVHACTMVICMKNKIVVLAARNNHE